MLITCEEKLKNYMDKKGLKTILIEAYAPAS